MKIKCKKSLYKSTYKGNAFTKGKIYELTPTIYEREPDVCFVIDNNGKEFSFTRNSEKKYEHFIEDFFHINDNKRFYLKDDDTGKVLTWDGEDYALSENKRDPDTLLFNHTSYSEFIEDKFELQDAYSHERIFVKKLSKKTI